jgi:hypothetical protein
MFIEIWRFVHKSLVCCAHETDKNTSKRAEKYVMLILPVKSITDRKFQKKLYSPYI